MARVVIAEAGLAGRRLFAVATRGNLATTTGRSAAIADVGWACLSGLVAWLLSGRVRIHFPIGFRNRAAILPDWIRSCLAFRRGARLIAGASQ